MTDNPTLAPQTDEVLGASDLLSDKKFRTGFKELTERLPELSSPDLQRDIEKAGRELIDKIKINPEMFDSPVHTLLFTAIAKRKAQRAEGNEDEEAFAQGAARMLAYKKSGTYSEFADQLDKDEDTVNDERRKEVQDEFTDWELTARMKKLINDGLLDQVKKRLQINGNEDPFELRVLSVAGHEGNVDGMYPAIRRDFIEVSLTDEESADNAKKLDAYKAYVAHLKENDTAYKEAMGKSEELPGAWVTTIDGIRYLCLPDPVARKLLDPDTAIQSDHYTHTKEYGDRTHGSREIALLEHEYTHTQGGLTLDDGVFFGVNFEEARAELFSGNMHGYTSTKMFLRSGLAPITGFSIDSYFPKNPKGGDKDIFYEDLASKVGLDSMLELAISVPPVYVDDSRPIQSSVNAKIGGYDDILMRLLEASPDREVAMDRMTRFAQSRKEAIKPEDDFNFVEMWLGMMSRDGMGKLAELYKKELEKLDISGDSSEQAI